MDYTVHGILQARKLERVAIPYSRGSSQPRDQTQVSRTAGVFFTSWATREALTNSCEKKRSEKQRIKRYKHLNAEFQRIARRDEKAFLSNQCKEIEENNRMGKTRDLFKKIRDTKGTFHAKMGSIKDRNSMDLTDAEDVKKRWQLVLNPYLFSKSCLKWPETHDSPGTLSQFYLRCFEIIPKVII